MSGDGRQKRDAVFVGVAVDADDVDADQVVQRCVVTGLGCYSDYGSGEEVGRTRRSLVAGLGVVGTVARMGPAGWKDWREAMMTGNPW